MTNSGEQVVKIYARIIWQKIMGNQNDQKIKINVFFVRISHINIL